MSLLYKAPLLPLQVRDDADDDELVLVRTMPTGQMFDRPPVAGEIEPADTHMLHLLHPRCLQHLLRSLHLHLHLSPRSSRMTITKKMTLGNGFDKISRIASMQLCNIGPTW
jgi:hypothetical protein